MTDLMPVDQLAAALDVLDRSGRLAHLHREPARVARFAQLMAPLPDRIVEALDAPRLWSHQVEAIDAVRSGRSVVLSTGTASGKSLVFQAAIAEAVLAGGTALAIYPTKALAQDQLRSFGDLAARGLGELVAATFDGDTATEVRSWVRTNANVILTNPEMVHGAMLPNHTRWASFLRALRVVVIDEMHVLRGIFGGHVAMVLRRLRRLCARYGSDPVFVFCSATIGEPAALATALAGLDDVAAVSDDGSPRGERWTALVNPPVLDERRGVRASTNGEVAEAVADLVSIGHRAVAFCRSRRATESIALDVRRRLRSRGASLRTIEGVRSYRAGYLASERRAIEADIFEGRASAVVATNALELGVDIGGLDACVLAGFPGTVSSLRQQLGRAGRSQQRSVGVLVAGTDQLDQWIMSHPTALFTRPPEPAVVNLANPYVLLPHLGCAAYEAPLTSGDRTWWGDALDEGVRVLALDDRLRVSNGRAHWCGRGSPSTGIGLRSGSQRDVRIVDVSECEPRTVGTVDAGRAWETVHPGALYLHLGQQFSVRSLDMTRLVAEVEPTNVDEVTDARTTLTVRIESDEASTAVGGAGLWLGDVEVTSEVVGYERRVPRSGEVIERVALQTEPTTLATRAFWYTIDDDVLAAARLTPDRVPGTLHAIEHAAIGMLPLFTICDRWDVGGVSLPSLPSPDERRGAPATIVIYDAYPGGAGIAELGYAAGRRHLEATLAVISRCRCEEGCPSCVQSPKCGNGNDPLDKAGAVALLRAILA
jgi:DEAD/DEAH box helicase domain-containing protein